MSLDERIKHIAQQAIAEAGTAGTDSGLAAVVSRLRVEVAELGFKLDATRARIDDVHTELHAVATRVTALEQAATPGVAPRASRPRKTTAE